MGSEENIEDYELIRRFKAKDESAFNALYAKYRLPLFGYIHKLLPNTCDATIDDYFQQVWIKVVAGIDSYSDNQKFFAWDCRIAHNLVIDAYRRNAGRQYVEIVDNIQGDVGVGQLEERLAKEKMVDVVEQCIAQLPSQQREVVEFRRSGLSFKEIADRQSTTLNTVLGRMHYAVSRIREMLKGFEEQE